MAVPFPTFAASPTAISISLNSLADTGAADSTVIDNTSDRYVDADLEVKLTGTSGSIRLASIYLLRSIDGVDFTDGLNAELVGMVAMNGAAQVTKVLRVYNLPAFYKVRVVNDSGGALAGSENEISMLGISANI